MTDTSRQVVAEAITSRRSVRAFLPTPVTREIIEDILQVAARAPSGTNTQPWRAYVVSGPAKDALSEKLVTAYNDPVEDQHHAEEYAYYPRQWISPYIDRRRKVGWDLYSLLGITKDDKAGMHAQHARNYRFFDAPVGLLFTIERILERGSWLDYGMFLQNIMIAARGHGLHTCPQFSLTRFHRIIAQDLEIPDNEMMVCGMALGYEDQSKIENTLRTERAPLAEWVKFVG